MNPKLASSPFEFQAFPPTLFGPGEAKRLPALVCALGARSVLLVTDPGVRASGVIDQVAGLLAAADIPVEVFDGIAPSPVPAQIEAGAERLRAIAADVGSLVVVVAIGGGSAIDSAKAIALHAANTVSLRALDYRNHIANPAFPIIAIPTTAGTGSETNSFAVITDHNSNTKFYVGDASCLPRTAILDPLLTLGLPKNATAACGMDVLTHSLESLAAKHPTPYSDGLALQSIGMVARFLPVAIDDGADIEARSQMLVAAHLAGHAFALTGLGLAHGIGHPLSTRVGTSHGGGLAIVLEHVMRFNLSARADRYARAAFALGVGRSDAGDAINAAAAIEAVAQLSRRAGTAVTLRSVGVTEELLPLIAQDALDDVVTQNNPTLPTHADVMAILAAALD